LKHFLEAAPLTGFVAVGAVVINTVANVLKFIPEL